MPVLGKREHTMSFNPTFIPEAQPEPISFQLPVTTCQPEPVSEELVFKRAAVSRIERIIIDKLGPGHKLNEAEFEVILLDGTRLVELEEEDKVYLEKFTGAQSISLSNCGLRSLKNLPVLPNIVLIDLSDNQLQGDDLSAIYHAFKKVKQLILANNSIRDRDLNHIAQLSRCQQLQSLDLSANPLTEMQSYRENVFEKLPHLEALDGFNKDGDEWSVLSVNELREDEDYWLHQNPDVQALMDEGDEMPYTIETIKMRRDGENSSDESHSSGSVKSDRRFKSASSNSGEDSGT